MPDGAAAALNAESCVSSRPHVTADVMTRGPARRARGAGTRRSNITHRSLELPLFLAMKGSVSAARAVRVLC
jgi:hypothetical protein